MGKKKVVVFGLGRVYRTFLDVYDRSKMEIIALSDNNRSLFEMGIGGGENLVKPEEINKLDFDYIIVTCSFYDEIKKQLEDYGIHKECILNFYSVWENLLVQDNYQNHDELLELLKGNVPMALHYEYEFYKLRMLQEKNLFLSAKNFINSTKNQKINTLEEVEFQVYSQFGEDGIIQWLIHNVEIENKTFVEFGVDDYSEANTRFLLMNNNWSGLVMDGNVESVDRLKQWNRRWLYDLTAIAAFITKDNINTLISQAGYAGDIGILSIDLDGNDYWILKAIDCVSPRILICEYNNAYGMEEMVSVPYDAEFMRTKKHYSNLYWGASIAAFCDWAEKNGYYYMGSNSAGNNAFFARKDCIKKEMVPARAKVFVESKYRESIDEKGQFTYLGGIDRLKCMEEMELVNLKTNCVDTIKNIYNI